MADRSFARLILDAITARRCGRRLAEEVVFAKSFPKCPDDNALQRIAIRSPHFATDDEALGPYLIHGLVDQSRGLADQRSPSLQAREFLELLNGEEGRRAEEPFRVYDLRFEFELSQFGLKELDVIAAHVRFEISAL